MYRLSASIYTVHDSLFLKTTAIYHVMSKCLKFPINVFMEWKMELKWTLNNYLGGRDGILLLLANQVKNLEEGR